MLTPPEPSRKLPSTKNKLEAVGDNFVVALIATTPFNMKGCRIVSKSSKLFVAHDTSVIVLFHVNPLST
jgi:membrane protein CcdC involved in cytochrome C biogenesis